MNRRYLLPLVIVILAGFSLLAGCSKDDDNPASGNKSRKELLVSKTWELKAATTSGVDIKVIVETQIHKLKFSDDGTVKVDAKSGTSFTSNWVLASNDSQIIFDQGTSEEVVVNIVSLTDSEFKAKMDFSDGTNTYPTDLIFR